MKMSEIGSLVEKGEIKLSLQKLEILIRTFHGGEIHIPQDSPIWSYEAAQSLVDEGRLNNKSGLYGITNMGKQYIEKKILDHSK